MKKRPVLDLEALSLGPAVPLGDGALRVRGVYRSVANLEVEGWPYLVALTTVGATALPNSIELPLHADFAASGLRCGESGWLENGYLFIPSFCKLDLARALRRPGAALAASGKLGVAYRACLSELTRHQTQMSCDLRVGSIIGPGADRARGERNGDGSGPFAARLELAARDASSAARS
ncbi:MAG: hypothetical protein Q8M76_07735, partial [Spirochaetaceae bacterium]|nr:hypothetical protein [Spirochaetaceae bacterium]